MKFEDIQKANETIKTISIKGKNYAEVNQRIKAFRMLCPTGTIQTQILSNNNGVVIIKATAGYYEDGELKILGTGTAYEKESSSFINETSYIENCETSAVGRALGMIGLGIETSVASAEELQNAINNQRNAEPKATEKQLEVLRNAYKGDNLTKLLKAQGVDKLEDITVKNASSLIGKLKEANNE